MTDPLWTDGVVVIGCRQNTGEFIARLLADGRTVSGIVTIGAKVAARAQVPA